MSRVEPAPLPDGALLARFTAWQVEAQGTDQVLQAAAARRLSLSGTSGC